MERSHAPQKSPEKKPFAEFELVNGIFFEVCDNGESFDLFLRKSGAQGEPVRTPLSVPGFTFHPREGFAVAAISKAVFVDLDAFKQDPRAIFALLHELGHASLLHQSGDLRAWAIAIANTYRDKSLTCAQWTVAHERAAWAEALRMSRQLRDEGYDLFRLFQSKDELSRWVREAGLSSYEDALAEFIAEREGSHILGIPALTAKKMNRKKKYS